MPNQSSDDTNHKSTTIVNAFVSPPLPNWEQLRDVPEPSGPIPEDGEDDAISKEEALKAKEVKEAKYSGQEDKGEK